MGGDDNGRVGRVLRASERVRQQERTVARRLRRGRARCYPGPRQGSVVIRTVVWPGQFLGKAPGTERIQSVLEQPPSATPGWELCQELEHAPESLFQALAIQSLVKHLRAVYARGWQPAELVRVAQLRVDARARDLMRWLVAADWATQTDAQVDPRWRDQMVALELSDRELNAMAQPTLGGASGWLGTWMARRRYDRRSPVVTVLEVAGLLVGLPDLDVLIPPPGVTPHVPAGATRQQTLPGVTGHSAGEPGSIPGEELCVARLPLDRPYPKAKALLLQIVATRFGCQMTPLPGLFMARVTGPASEVATTEHLITSLQTQADHALARTTAGAPLGSRWRSRRFRSAFLVGFIERVEERLAPRPVSSDPLHGQVARAQVPGGRDRDGHREGRRAGGMAALVSPPTNHEAAGV